MGSAHTDSLRPLKLPLGYPVFCQAGVLHHLGEVVDRVAPSHRIAIMADEIVAGQYCDALLSQFTRGRSRVFPVPSGEQEKTRERWASLTDQLLEWGAGRDTTVVAVGGGVVCDLAGFVAATYMRGLPVVQVPTTLLAMVDASMGGKTGVDTPAGKNLVGAFHDPAAVAIDPQVLSTLPRAILRSGLAEMLKHGVIADVLYFNQILDALPSILEYGADAPGMTELIAGSLRIKAAVVADDAFEGGRRQILNFGHTIGHAVEKLTNYEMLHGDAVALGMVVEARIAERIGLAVPGLFAQVGAAVAAANLPASLPTGVSVESVVRETHGDKKARSGATRYALPRAMGEMETADGRWSLSVDDAVVTEVLAQLG